jgi:hypothetical protein
MMFARSSPTTCLACHPPLPDTGSGLAPSSRSTYGSGLLPAPARHQPLAYRRLPSSLCCVLLCMLEVVEGGQRLLEVVEVVQVMCNVCAIKAGVTLETAVRSGGGSKVWR